MNANEHLDFYNPDSIYYGNSRHYIQQLEAMLRQQQAEIEALKQIIDANNLNQNIGQFVKPTNEPVAWMHQNPDYAISKHQSLEYNIPLYTHPEQDESFDRTASHMAGEYVSYPAKEPTDELNSLKKENKFFKEILSEMDKQVYNIEFLKQPMQILENGQIVPVFKELTDEEIANTWDDVRKDATLKSSMKDIQDFARAILRKAQEK